MSSMLEQAIVDANALKEAAIKNAEQEVLEKYSQDIKEAVNALLEQDEEGDLFADEVEDEPVEDEPVLDQIPPAATAGEELCPCPDDEEVVEVDLEALLQASETEEPAADELRDREDVVGDIADQQELRGIRESQATDEEEEIELKETDLLGLIEELVFDYKAQPAGYSSGLPVPELDLEQHVEKLSKEIEEARKESDELKESLDSTQKENNKFRRIVLQLKDKLDEVTVSNARLLYTNRVLGDDSLNERQKSKIVETISKAQTIEEAKMIYGTLQSAVDGSAFQNKPKSLNEAVSRQSTMLFSRQARSGRATSDPALERMQRLAGITKN